ncbi:MAG: iron-containing alcohol dehydrogenase [Verrucomicrobia bacterium]|nr:iron-containing alcohol dehydrogenase [Verrucomicrobiota bacterium]
MISFEFATAARIIFGAGRAKELGGIIAEFGKRALLVHPQPVPPPLAECVLFAVEGEPTLSLVRDGTALARREGCDVVVGFGGGSAMDTAKAIAALLANGGDPLDYAEVVGKGKSLTKPSVPFIAVPTTAGTGAEVTRNAVLGAPEHKVKVSMRSPFMLARVALVDPLLTLGLPPAVTASTGLDALTQLIEPFVSRKANPMTDAICREGMRCAARSLRRAFEHGDDVAAREDMSLASLCGGLALANAGLGAVHGFAAPIGGMFPQAPHGAVCAALLAPVMEMNAHRAPHQERFKEVEQIVGDIGDLVRALNIPGLRTHGVTEADFPSIIEKAAAASSMKGNPILLSTEELREILSRAL